MWQRFTENARSVVLFAQAEAGKARSLNVDTEHLLLGIFVTDENRITRLLAAMGVNAGAVPAEAKSAVVRFPQKSADEEPRLTPLAKRVLEFSADEARRASHKSIDVEHLLLGLIREVGGQASQILVAQGADLERARAVAIRELEIAEQSASYRVTPLSGLQFDQEIADVLEGSLQWAILSQSGIGAEELLLSLLERRTDLSVEILGLDVLALKKARLKLLVRLNLWEEAALLRDEIENEHS